MAEPVWFYNKCWLWDC